VLRRRGRRTTQPERDIELSDTSANTAVNTTVNNTLSTSEPQTPRQKPPRLTDRSFEVFRESSLYFAIAIMIANSIIILEDRSRHTIIFSFLGAAFTASVLSGPWQRHHDDGREGEGVVDFYLSTSFMLFSVIPSVITLSSGSKSSDLEERCLPFLVSGLSPFLPLLFFFAPFSLLITGFIDRWFGFKFTIMAIPISHFPFMYISLGIMASLRYQMSEISNDKHFVDNKWGFGQILAVVAWLPTLWELIRIACKFIWTCPLFSFLFLLLLFKF